MFYWLLFSFEYCFVKKVWKGIILEVIKKPKYFQSIIIRTDLKEISIANAMKRWNRVSESGNSKVLNEQLILLITNNKSQTTIDPGKLKILTMKRTTMNKRWKVQFLKIFNVKIKIKSHQFNSINVVLFNVKSKFSIRN